MMRKEIEINGCIEIPPEMSSDEFYDILDEEYKQYELINAIESQRTDYPRDDSSHTFVSVGTNGFGIGKVF